MDIDDPTGSRTPSPQASPTKKRKVDKGKGRAPSLEPEEDPADLQPSEDSDNADDDSDNDSVGPAEREALPRPSFAKNRPGPILKNALVKDKTIPGGLGRVDRPLVLYRAHNTPRPFLIDWRKSFLSAFASRTSF